jgi:hypothetical protein
MPADSLKNIKKLLASNRPGDLSKGLELVRQQIDKSDSTESRSLFEIITPLFYIDTLDHPELVPILNEAIDLTVRFGSWVIPILVDNLDEGDIKAQWAISHVLGRMGSDAIQPLVRQYASADNPTLRAFILYALGKVKSPQVVQAISPALEAAQAENLELRDTATRALGKFIESIPPGDLSKDIKRRIINGLRQNLSDPNASVRSKAIRSLGKMARYAHLTEAECSQLKAVCRRILGTDENGEWDRAYIVRKEAEESLAHLMG